MVSYECDEPLKAAIPLVSYKGRIDEKEIFVQITDDGTEEFPLIHFHDKICFNCFHEEKEKSIDELFAKKFYEN